MNDLVTDIAELEETICSVMVKGKECLGVLFEDWTDAWGFCRAGSVTGALDDHPPTIVHLDEPVEINWVKHRVLLYWPRQKWTLEMEKAFSSARTVELE